MRLNWKLFKVLCAFPIIFATIAWAPGSLHPTSYSRSSLNFGLGSGAVTVTNPLDKPGPVHLVGSEPRSFVVSSTIEGASSSSAREGTGISSTYVFTITRDADVKSVVDAATRLQARANPLSADSAHTPITAAFVIVFGALFYAFKSTGHGLGSRPSAPEGFCSVDSANCST
jgi:hypothetical protein